MKLKVIEGFEAELFESTTTQVATLEINKTLLANDEIVRRARELIKSHGSAKALEDFDLAVKWRIDNE